MCHNSIIAIKQWCSIHLVLTFILLGFPTSVMIGQESLTLEAERLESIATKMGLFNDKSLEPLLTFKSYVDSHALVDFQYQANYLLGKYHLLRLNSREALTHFKEASSFAGQMEAYELQGFALDRMGISYINLNKPDSALVCFQTSMDIYSAHALEHRLWTPLHGISQLYQSKENYEKATYYGELALNSIQRFDEPIAETILLNHMIVMASEFGNARDYSKYLDQYLSTVDPEKLMDDNTHLALFYHSKSEPAEQIKEVKKAIELLSGKEPTLSLVNAYYRLGKIYFNEKQYAHAIDAWSEGHQVNDEIEGVGFRLAFYKSLSDAYGQLGLNKMAMQTLKDYYTIKDSLAKMENVKKLDELELKYETAQKEETIALQEFALKQKTRERNILAVAGGLLILAILLIIRVLHARLKAQKIIAQQELEALQQKHSLEALHAMVKGQEEERKRIAFDLHDGLGGLLSTAKHQMEKLLDKVDTSNLNGEAVRTSKMIDMACEDVRRIAHNMMPHALMKMGLVAAIGDLVNLQASNSEVDLSFQCITELDRMDEEREIMIYRIVQELVQNAVKHAEATSIIIQISQHDNVLSLVVEDDGRGFDQTKTQGKGLGLKSIDSRVKFLNGKIDIESSLASGTTVTIDIPVKLKPLQTNLPKPRI